MPPIATEFRSKSSGKYTASDRLITAAITADFDCNPTEIRPQSNQNRPRLRSPMPLPLATTFSLGSDRIATGEDRVRGVNGATADERRRCRARVPKISNTRDHFFLSLYIYKSIDTFRTFSVFSCYYKYQKPCK